MNSLATERAAFLVENLDIVEATQNPDAVFESFQLRFLQDMARFSVILKCRQAGFSWLIAAEAVARALLHGESSLVQSINQQESQEKIRYAMACYNALPGPFRLKLITQNKSEIEWENGARFISLPGVPFRGKGRFHIYVDEWAHIMRAREIYTAILPSFSKLATGQFRGGSSPRGTAGLFWEIFTQKNKPYPGYSRYALPWWKMYSFSTNPLEAIVTAPRMTTKDRVYKYGNERIIEIYENFPLTSFQQEYECAFLGDSLSLLTWSLIRQNQRRAHENYLATVTSTDQVTLAFEAIRKLAEAIEAGRIERIMFGGYDVGRVKDTSELWIIGKTSLDDYPVRLGITMGQLSFDDQWSIIELAMKIIPIVMLYIDRNGIGMQLAETAELRYPFRAKGFNMTMQSKAELAILALRLFQQRRAPIPTNLALGYELNSIKKVITGHNNIVYQVEVDKGSPSHVHHGDKAWALFQAYMAANSLFILEQTQVPVIPIAPKVHLIRDSNYDNPTQFYPTE